MLQIYSPNQVEEIAFELKNNKCVVLPTDTVWGIVSLDENLIYKIKHRKRTKKIIRFINNLSLVKSLDNKFINVLLKYLPGALTFIFKKQAYRIPNNELILKLTEKVGFLYSSSANISGKKPIENLQEATSVFGKYSNAICFVDGKDKQKVDCLPSTIIDLDRMIVIRQGEINGEKILQEIDQTRS